MVTYEELRACLGARPFTPFRLHLKSGEVLDVTRRNRGIAMRRQAIIVVGLERLRFVAMPDMDRIEMAAKLAG